MSSFLSAPYQIQAPQESVNVQLVGATLNTLQTRYDNNKSIVDQTLAKYEMLRGLSDSDNEYIVAKVKEAESAIENFSKKNGNLAKSSVRDTMLTALESVYKDPIVQNAIQNKAIYDNFNAEVSKRKEKGDGTYNDMNYSYALYKGGVQEYMQGKTKKLGSLNYTPYKDLTEEHLKKLKVIKDLKGKRYIETPDEQGSIIRKDIDGLTEGEIQNYFGSILTSEELTQMKINGWARYGQNEDQARKNYTDLNTKNIEKLRGDLDVAKKNLKSTSLNPVDRQSYETEVKIIERDIENAQSNLDSSLNLPIDEIALSLEKIIYLNGLANIASTEWSQSIEKDDTWFARRQLEIDYEELALKKEKNLREIAEFNLKNNINADGTPNYDDKVSVSSEEGDLNKEGKGVEGLQERFDNHIQVIRTTAKDVYDKLEDEDKEAFKANLKRFGVDENFAKMSNFPQGASLTNNIFQAFKETGLAKRYKEATDVMTDAKIKKDGLASDIVSAKSKAYSRIVNEELKGYIDNAKVAYNATKTIGLAFDTALAVVTKDTKSINNVNRTKQAREELETFVQKNGGWDKLSENIKNSPIKLEELDRLTNDIAKYSYNFVSKKNLKEDSKQYIEKALLDASKSKTSNTFSVYDSINIIDENLRKTLIDRMPQQRIEGENFNEKSALTVRRVGNNLEVIQSQGEETIPGSNGKKRKVFSKITVDKGDAVFTELSKIVDFEESKRMTYSAENFKSFDATKPKVNTNPDYKDSSYEIQNISSVERTLSSNPNVAKPFLAGGNPLNWATAQAIENNMPFLLSRVLNEQQANDFTENYLKQINSFKLKAVSKMSPRTNNKTWHLEYYNPYGRKLDTKDLNITNIDKDTKYLIDFHPEVFISEFLAQDIISDPKFINTVFKEQ